MGKKEIKRTIDHCARVSGTTLKIEASGLKVITIICKNVHTKNEANNCRFENKPMVLNE